MKLASLSIVLTAAAGLVSAAPIRIIIVTSTQHVAPADPMPAWLNAVRWGHAAAPAFNSLPPLNHPTPTPARLSIIEAPRLRQKMRKGGCRGGMRAKSMQLGNKLRIMLGLPPIDYLPRPHHGMMRGTVVEALPQSKVAPTYRHHIRPHIQRVPFTIRLSHALASLGPWEGRAVSFVLGCGLGAILRMLFVFGVLVVRSVRARGQERQVALEEDTVIFVADVKEPIIMETPPEYAEKTDDAPQGQNSAN